MTVMLTAPVDDAQELTLRAQSVLREAGWFVRCEGEADVARLNAILRVGTVVQINGAGALNSGKYFVWSVRHTIDKQSHKMKFVLVRNAVGTPPSSGGGLVGSTVMNSFNEQALLDVLDRFRYRFYGKYRGTVTDVDASTLRIKATVPSVLGTQPTGLVHGLVFRMPARMSASHFLPETGRRGLDRI